MTDTTKNIDYTARDFATIKESLSRYVVATEPLLWSDFFESNLGVILIDFVAYVGDIVSYVADRVSEEVFPATATRRQSLLKFSKAVGYSPRGSSPASVRVSALASALGVKFLTQGVTFNKGTSFTTGGITFEVDQDYYFHANTARLEMDCSSGTSGQEVFTGSGVQYQEYEINVPSVIDNSWQVLVDGIEWEYVDSVLLREAERVYEVVYTDRGYIIVRFGNGYNGRIPNADSEIIINYRSGGGVSDNVEARSIATTLVGYFDDGSSIAVGVANVNRASGGLNAESNEHIQKWLPHWVKTNNRAVSAEDYTAMVNKFVDPVYGSPHRGLARLRISGYGNIVKGIYPETRHIPYTLVSDYEIFGIGRGVLAVFGYNTYTYTTRNTPVVPNTVAITGTVEYSGIVDVFRVRDDGNGLLVGDFIDGGTVDYENGTISVTFRGHACPQVDSVMNLYYEYSPLADEGYSHTDRSYLLGVGTVTPATYIYNGTVPVPILHPNQDSYTLNGITGYGVRLLATLYDVATNTIIPIELFDGVLNVAAPDIEGSFWDVVTGAPSGYVVSSNINYATGVIDIEFTLPPMIYTGVIIYYTDSAYVFDQGDGVENTFTCDVGARIIPSTIRVHCIVGAQDVWIRDNTPLPGVWELEVINTASGIVVSASDINYLSGHIEFTLEDAVPAPAPPDNLTDISIAYQSYEHAVSLPYGALAFVRAIETIGVGGLENAGIYQWLYDRWHLLATENTGEYVLPANVVDVYLWSLDATGHLSHVSDSLISAVREHLYDNGVITVQLNTVTGSLQPFNLDLGNVYYDKKYDANTLRTQIYNAVLALVTGDTNYPGESITLSEIYKAIMSVSGILGFRIARPANNITVNKNEMATFGKVERENSGIIGRAHTQVIGLGTGAPAPIVYHAVLGLVSPTNQIVETANSVKIETYIIPAATGLTALSVAYSRVHTPPPPNTMSFENTVANGVDEAVAATYVDIHSGAIQVTFVEPVEDFAIILATYWTENAVFAGALQQKPIIGGTVMFEVGDYVVVDDGAGGLTGTNVTGSINYETGVFEFTIINGSGEIPPLYDGVTVYATYQYTYNANLIPWVRGRVIDNTGYCPDWTCPS